jgi:hypothetical protein
VVDFPMRIKPTRRDRIGGIKVEYGVRIFGMFGD